MECDVCGKPATRNYQKLWVKWKHYPETGKYSKTPEILDNQDKEFEG